MPEIKSKILRKRLKLPQYTEESLGTERMISDILQEYKEEKLEKYRAKKRKTEELEHKIEELEHKITNTFAEKAAKLETKDLEGARLDDKAPIYHIGPFDKDFAGTILMPRMIKQRDGAWVEATVNGKVLYDVLEYKQGKLIGGYYAKDHQNGHQSSISPALKDEIDRVPKKGFNNPMYGITQGHDDPQYAPAPSAPVSRGGMKNEHYASYQKGIKEATTEFKQWEKGKKHSYVSVTDEPYSGSRPSSFHEYQKLDELRYDTTSPRTAYDVVRKHPPEYASLLPVSSVSTEGYSSLDHGPREREDGYTDPGRVNSPQKYVQPTLKPLEYAEIDIEATKALSNAINNLGLDGNPLPKTGRRTRHDTTAEAAEAERIKIKESESMPNNASKRPEIRGRRPSQLYI